MRMCNDYRLEVDIASIAEDFDDLKIKIDMPEGAPNVPAREDVRITDMGPIVKASDGSAIGELVNRRWSWPGQGGKPVYNVRSEEHTSELQSLMRISYAVFCLKKKKKDIRTQEKTHKNKW